MFCLVLQRMVLVDFLYHHGRQCFIILLMVFVLYESAQIRLFAKILLDLLGHLFLENVVLLANDSMIVVVLIIRDSIHSARLL